MVQKQSDPPNNIPNPQTQYHEPTAEEKSVELNAYLTPQEKEYYDIFISIVSKLQLPNNVKVVKDDTISEFIRTAMAFMSNWYVGSLFVDSNLIGRLPDKKTKREFIAFRTKFMNIPAEVQFEDLRRLGYVKPKQEK